MENKDIAIALCFSLNDIAQFAGAQSFDEWGWNEMKMDIDCVHFSAPRPAYSAETLACKPVVSTSSPPPPSSTAELPPPAILFQLPIGAAIDPAETTTPRAAIPTSLRASSPTCLVGGRLHRIPGPIVPF